MHRKEVTGTSAEFHVGLLESKKFILKLSSAIFTKFVRVHAFSVVFPSTSAFSEAALPLLGVYSIRRAVPQDLNDLLATKATKATAKFTPQASEAMQKPITKHQPRRREDNNRARESSKSVSFFATATHSE